MAGWATIGDLSTMALSFPELKRSFGCNFVTFDKYLMSEIVKHLSADGNDFVGYKWVLEVSLDVFK